MAHPGLSPTSTAGEPKAIPSEIEFKKFSEALARCEKWDKAVRLSYSILVRVLGKPIVPSVENITYKTAADEVKNLTKVLYQVSHINTNLIGHCSRSAARAAEERLGRHR